MQIFDRLDNVVTDSYNKLDEEVGISRNMDPLLAFTGQMQNLSGTLTEVQRDADTLQRNVEDLSVDIETLKQNITSELSSCSDEVCINMTERVNKTVVDVNYTDITSGYNVTMAGLQVAIQENLNFKLEVGYNSFKSIVDNVNQSVSGEIESARDAADEIAGTIGKELDNVEEDIGTVDFAGGADSLREVSQDDMELPAYITFWSFAGIASILALIVLLTYLGLLFGSCPRANREKDYCCTSKMGATCLLAGVGFTFIFYWILLLVLLPMFLAGGLTQTEICRHAMALDESPISGIIDELVNASFYDDTGFSINITEIYRSCKADEAFYTALDAENTFGFNLTDLLDTSAIDEEIDRIKEVNVTIGNIEILNNDTKLILQNLAEPLSEAAADTHKYIAELGKNVTSENLKILAEDLRILAKDQPIPTLIPFANDLEKLYNDSVVAIDEQRILTQKKLISSQSLLNTNISGITNNLVAGQEVTNSEGEDIIQSVVNDTATDVEDVIDVAVKLIDNNVRYRIGKCEPVYNAVATIVDSACIELLYALNGYWFALGWSVFFLLISVILSLKLSTICRKTMDHDQIVPEERRGGRPPRHQRYNNTDSAVLIVRSDSHEMVPVTNPVYSVDGQYPQKIPRPQLKHGVAVYPQERAPFVGRPPSYSESQYKMK